MQEIARERWSKRTAFVMAAVGSAVGLGCVWRFPYIAYSNGGGAFFIPYLIALITTGIPLLSLEYYLGSRYQRAPTEVFGQIRKKSDFIGWFAVVSAAMILFYYTVVMSWALNYVFHSVGVKWAGIESEFFFQRVLGATDSVGRFGSMQWLVVLGNFFTWAAIFVIIAGGVKRIGKVINWFVVLPLVLLLVLIVRGITLPGAGAGLDFYLKPDFSLLARPGVWLGAYGQIFFSLSLGFGIMIAYASYLPKGSDINANAWTVSFATCLTSFFAGFAVFSAVGYVAFVTDAPVEAIAGAGPGLAFVIYPAAIAELPGGIWVQSFFGILFFLMLLGMGIDSAFSIVEAMVSGLKDSFKMSRFQATLLVCAAGFAAGTIYSTGAGIYWLDIVDHWVSWSLVLAGLMQAVLVGWFTDIRKASQRIDEASDIKFGILWRLSVKYVTPVVLFSIIAFNVVEEFGNPYMGYPAWALLLGGWALVGGVMFLAAYMQNRKELPLMREKNARLVAWSVLYAGFVATAGVCYATGSAVSPVVMLIGSAAVGGWLIRSIDKLNIPLVSKKEGK